MTALYSLLFALLFILDMVSSALGQMISHTPSEGSGVSYSVNVPESTARLGRGPIFLQLKAPDILKWIAFGQGDQMTSGNLFIVYSAPNGNVTLSTRKAAGHYEPKYNSSIQASLLEGSGIHHGFLVANVRCDSCMTLDNGDSIMRDDSPWIWAMTHGPPLVSTNVSEKLYQHDWHGIFSFNMTQAVGGEFPNPFFMFPPSHKDFPPIFRQQQISDTLLHKKRIAHGVMTSIAFVLLFPNFGLLLHLIPSRYTVAWIHAPLQMFAVFLALAGFVLGVEVSKDLQELTGYHPMLGYFCIGGVVIFQPILGIMQHLHFRKTGGSSLYGISHRWLGRFLSAFGVLNGGLGFHYACTKNPDIPPVSPMAYGIIAACVFSIYVLVLGWRKWRNHSKAVAQTRSEAQVKSAVVERSDASRSALFELPTPVVAVTPKDESKEKAWKS